MIYAELKHKIPETKNSEDVLTSNVFTFFKILPEKYILQLICEMVPSHIKNQIKDRNVCEFSIWKRFSNLKEPEIYIKLEPEYHVFIEIKYRSPESGETQLKNYLDLIPSENKILIYLTADRTEPVWTTQKAIYQGLPIFWVNWYKLKTVVEEFAKNESDEIVRNIYNLIVRYLNHKGFSCFDGWPADSMLGYMKTPPKIWKYEG